MTKPDITQGEQARLETLRSLSILDTPPEERFDRLTRMAKRLFGVPIALVGFVDENRQWSKSCFGLSVNETSRDISFCGHAILGNDVFIIPDAIADERFADNPLVLFSAQARRQRDLWPGTKVRRSSIIFIAGGQVEVVVLPMGISRASTRTCS